MDVFITSLRLLTGLLLAIVSFGVFLPYSVRPEDFFIKRLRPTSGRKITSPIGSFSPELLLGPDFFPLAPGCSATC